MRIRVNLGTKSLGKDLENYIQKIDMSRVDASKELAIKGASHMNRMLSKYRGAFAYPQQINAYAWRIVGDGDQFPFVEFGAGVHFNDEDVAPERYDYGMVGIGEYGAGRGKNDYWYYNGEKFYGYKAVRSIYYTRLYLQRNGKRILREALKKRGV